MTTISLDSESVVLLRRKRHGVEQVRLLVQGLADLIVEEEQEYLQLLGKMIGKDSSVIRETVRSCEVSPSGRCVQEFAFGGSENCLLCERSFK